MEDSDLLDNVKIVKATVPCWNEHYMGAVRKSRSQIYELMRLLCFARLLKPASR